MQKILFYGFPLVMKDFLFKVANFNLLEQQEETSPFDLIWVSPKLSHYAIQELIKLDLTQIALTDLEEGYPMDKKKRALIYFKGIPKNQIASFVKVFKKAVGENFNLIFSFETEINIHWDFKTLWGEVTQDHDYFEELESSRREGRPFTLIPDDDKPMS